MLIFSKSERSFILTLVVLCLVCAGVSYSGKTFSSPNAETVDFEEPRYIVNINTVGIDELERLPGIGPVMAREIISHRDSSGGFKAKEDLKDVKGIGDKKFEKMKDLIIISE
ncbi:MAG: helix-hairpin-helix domain-containing protein [Candidatus Omnitrophica bacterium]|nr:helix-hairpin-helix domain-containing protein [Candidatus Omnitrophota bacterium]